MTNHFFLAGAFFTATSLVDTFLVATFLAGAFFTTTSLVYTFLVATFLAGAFFTIFSSAIDMKTLYLKI